jgi:peptidoglycan/xylan/chitin deacetylase (PgdA/CDA1 family)
MYLYSLDEQIKIIKDGKELVKEWTGENPVAHRAGAYGINEDTFVALKENGIPIDSSSFYGHPNCKAVVTKNKIVEHNGIIEIPVTVFRRVQRVKLGGWVLKRQSSYVKTDIDWANLGELKSFVKQAKENNVKVMTLFMHSYSLLKFDQDFTHFEPDGNDIEKLDKFLNYVANDPEIRVITMKEFYEMYQKDSEQFIGSDYVPVVEYNERFNPIKYSARRVKAIIKRLTKSQSTLTK